ncbi:hypothetical protein Kpol_1002p118 [Vanderwaltozyma polyspora DSM 70294]|uniref:Actin cytoskeleton-regulatory complex protein END3 n=1 Tax=Vanderwaltozyma polyspora (strain ATCC 22028 / DSM 70294 / BCRC 21397 / CBS 2163 / NBRC 10782 / NRRL Y-8283 / UCD 57-17) TaxID=436907 RepID=END3_VANPO|nr:uncharacterized protein Kpol_1002p118 [Vanderwaltozyma polyspora DSM 70294]A7TEE6.1 RecName: Full=Actin cytoskeleton-regulatory complex protein END3; AltName: Full=Endocytosis protein 3 [Vanderwaltozyma polyspora DSM 70294]EDO19468.1 hypothetical protein Kpol_1002p118 [Vanderwaltozyma polyspora DSM 70294]
MPKLEQFEIKKYWQIFSGLKPVENKVNHDQVLPILYNSKLDSSILNKIWFLADIDDDDNLDFEEFVICMRLIFDMVNKNIDKVPDELPDWLIPGSKAKLVKERKQRKQIENADIPKVETPKIDWYISPEDKKSYENILSGIQTATDGSYSYSSTTLVLKSKFFNIGTSDFEKTWKLVNPKNFASIDKDPTLYFIHILRQRNDLGCNIPSELPKALLDSFSKERVTYDLNSNQSQVTRSSNVRSNTNMSQHTIEAIRMNEIPRGNPNDAASLEIELNSLDAELNRIRDEITRQEDTILIREQFEGLLSYKEQQYQKSKQSSMSPVKLNAKSISDDLSNIEQQVGVLENYLADKKVELQQLESQIQSVNK